MDLDTAVELVHATSLYRIPEAIRAADGGSREVLRELMKEEDARNEREKDNRGEGGERCGGRT